MKTLMADLELLTVLEMFRTEPVESTLFLLVPLLLIVLQLANSVINGLSLTISIPFTIGLIAFSILLFQHQFARFSRKQLEEPT